MRERYVDTVRYGTGTGTVWYGMVPYCMSVSYHSYGTVLYSTVQYGISKLHGTVTVRYGMVPYDAGTAPVPYRTVP